MQVAVFSDIHANLPAFEAILRDSDEVGVEERWCLGDVVGYGAGPDLCIELARERCDVCLVGNHDLAVLGELDISTFSAAAAAAVEWTAENTSKRNLDFLTGLSALRHLARGGALPRVAAGPGLGVRALARPGCRLPRGPGQAGQLRRPFARGPVLLHRRAGAGGESAAEARGWQAGAGTRLEIDEGRWLINPGSVGQPRDGDPRAAWLELDTDSWEATYHRVGYDIERAAGAIEKAGLPDHLARRLFQGR